MSWEDKEGISVRRALLLIVRVGMGLLFLVSSLSKTADTDEFARTVARFDILPTSVVPYVAGLLPPFEYILAISLILGLYPRIAGAVASTLLVLFTAVVGYNLLRGNIVPCGCFDLVLKSEISVGAVARNLTFLAVCAWIWYSREHIASLSEYLQQRVSLCVQRRAVLPYGTLALLVPLFALALFVGGVPEKPLIRKGINGQTLIAKIDPVYQMETAETSFLSYGERLPDVVAKDIRERPVQIDRWRDSLTVLCVFTPATISSLEESLRYANVLWAMHRHEAVRVVLVLRFPGVVSEGMRARVIERIERTTKIPTLVDIDHRLSRGLKFPFVLCPIVVVADQHNIVRLALSSPPDDLVEEIINRYSATRKGI